jgi:hypothetical protein
VLTEAAHWEASLCPSKIEERVENNRKTETERKVKMKEIWKQRKRQEKLRQRE